MRWSIRTKIILLGSITSFLLISIALLISFFVYQNKAYSQLDKNVDKSVHEIKYNLGDSAVNFLKMAVGEIDEAAKITPDDPVMNTYSEKLDYYTKKYGFIYPGTGGFGLSYQKAAIRNAYMDISSDLKSAIVSSGGKSAFIGYIPENADRIYYLADAFFVFDDKYDSKLPLSDYKFFGSYQEITDSYYTATDYSNDEGFPCWTAMIDGYKHRVAEVFFGDGVYETDANGDSYETGKVFYIFIRYDMKEINDSVVNYLITEITSFSGSLLFLILLFGLASHFLIANNIIKLNSSTLEFTKSLSNKDKLEVITPTIKAKDEIGDLSKSFVSLETTLIDYIDQVERDAKEREKINAELEIASEIQLSALPTNFLNDENVLIKASIESAKEVGGDFYDYFYIDSTHLAIIVSDVSGKGVPAALFMMKSKELIRSKLINKESLSEVCYDVNNSLIDNNSQGLFITAFIGILNVKTKELEFVNAGHERPYLISKGKVTQLDVDSNFILGGIENYKYKEESIKLNTDDKLFIYTDGLNESINSNREEFGYERIKNALFENKDLQIGDCLKNISNKLSEFTDCEEAFDDVTMMLVELKSSNLEFRFENPDYEAIDKVNNKFNDYYSYIDKKVLSEFNIIFDELFNNYISYEKVDNLVIEVSVSLKNDMFELIIKNNGVEFNPLKRNDKYINSIDENTEVGGFGITIIKKLAEDISYKRKDNKNILIIKKSSKKESTGSESKELETDN